MPNRKLNPITRNIDENGHYHFFSWSPPQKIVRSGGALRLRRPDYVLAAGEVLEQMGYRLCPTHYEWSLMLRPHRGSDWYAQLIDGLATGRSLVPSGDVMRQPVFTIVREQNDWVDKGGSEEQVSVYFTPVIPKGVRPVEFTWVPTTEQLQLQLALAYGLYGWTGKDGLEAEIFSHLAR